ncbi:acetyltransferase [Winogradskyella sp.]|uniref:acetyltransferase n=1 Tax=Winogradskyella sp. TaxID=1883156 RepID=UPI0025D7C113|nr:acetyltransferase [Winogradskyella sp.]
MSNNKLTILGFSEPVLTMIFDNLESLNWFPQIEIVNNLQIEPRHAYINNKFDTTIVSSMPEKTDLLFLGVNKAINKQKVSKLFLEHWSKMTNVINKSVEISSTVNMGFGCMINSHVSIAGQTKIGNYVTINRNASVGHHSNLGDYVTVNPGAHIAGFVTIGKGTTIGMGAYIIDGIEIGKNVIIGAGALVTKNIESNVVAYGNPCKVIRKNEN